MYYGTRLDHSLINPNQVRAYGIDFWDNPFDKERGTSINTNDNISIALKTMGTKIYFKSWAPSQLELETCTHIHMTSRIPWNPTKITLNETSAIKKVGTNIQDGLKERLMARMPMISEVSRYDESLEDLPTRQTYTSTERHSKVSAEVLADRFAIGIQQAKETLKATMQRGTRSAILPISRRYRADRQYGVKRLNGKYATDTLWAKLGHLEVTSLHKSIATRMDFAKHTPSIKPMMKGLDTAYPLLLTNSAPQNI